MPTDGGDNLAPKKRFFFEEKAPPRVPPDEFDEDEDEDDEAALAFPGDTMLCPSQGFDMPEVVLHT